MSQIAQKLKHMLSDQHKSFETKEQKYRQKFRSKSSHTLVLAAASAPTSAAVLVHPLIRPNPLATISNPKSQLVAGTPFGFHNQFPQIDWQSSSRNNTWYRGSDACYEILNITWDEQYMVLYDYLGGIRAIHQATTVLPGTFSINKSGSNDAHATLDA